MHLGLRFVLSTKYILKDTMFVFSVLDWNELATEANAGSLFRCKFNEIDFVLMILVSLRNQDATSRTTSIKKNDFISRDTPKSFSFVSQCPNFYENESGTRRNI